MDIDKEMMIEAVEALIEKKEREANEWAEDSYEALKLHDEIYVLENALNNYFKTGVYCG